LVFFYARRLLHQYFPKGADLSVYSQAELTKSLES